MKDILQSLQGSWWIVERRGGFLCRVFNQWGTVDDPTVAIRFTTESHARDCLARHGLDGVPIQVQP